MFEANTSLFEHGYGVGTVVIPLFSDHPDYPAVDYQHGTGSAGSHFTVQGCSVYGYTAPGRLADGILFGMNGAYAMLRYGSVLMLHFLELMTNLVAMGKAGR